MTLSYPDAEFLAELEKREMARKTKTTELLFELLKSTGEYEDLKSMKYHKGIGAYPYSEGVVVRWEHSSGVINVGMDSCSALIRDVIKGLERTRLAE